MFVLIIENIPIMNLHKRWANIRFASTYNPTVLMEQYGEVISMRFLVTAKAFDTITREDEVLRIRQVFGEKVRQICTSGNMIEGGVFVDARGCFFLLDVDTATKLYELLSPLHDFCKIEIHPIDTFEFLEKLFKKLTPK